MPYDSSVQQQLMPESDFTSTDTNSLDEYQVDTTKENTTDNDEVSKPIVL